MLLIAVVLASNLCVRLHQAGLMALPGPNKAASDLRENMATNSSAIWSELNGCERVYYSDKFGIEEATHTCSIHWQWKSQPFVPQLTNFTGKVDILHHPESQ